MSRGKEAAPAPGDLPPSWPDLRDRLEERAAIREFDGGQPRAEAERAALAEAAAATGADPQALAALWRRARTAG